MPNLSKHQTDLGLLIDITVYLYLIGLVCSKALLSIATIGFALVALIAWFREKERSVEGFLPFFFPIIIFLITLLTGTNSEDKGIYFDFLQKKLPFLILPLAFFSVKEHIAERYHQYMVVFVYLVAIICLGVLGNYLMHFEQLNEAITRGQAISTPIDHTEFSIFVAFAAIVSVCLYLEKKRVTQLGTKLTLVYTALFLVIFLHILAVRSGIAVFYAAGLLVGLYYFIKERRFKLMLGFVVLSMLFPIIAINTIPSLKKKIEYVHWDLSKYEEGAGLNHSDSERMYSLRAGIDIFKTHPIIGVGVGDLKKECQKKYQDYVGKALDHYPHNQYLFVLASMGILGFIFYSFSLLGPLIVLRQQLDPYFLGLHGVLFVSALVENTLERTFSIAFYLFFVLLCISYLHKSWDQQKS